MRYNKSTMIYDDYNWTIRQKDDPKVTGELDHTLFNRRNGHEMLYLINGLMKSWSLMHLREGRKLELMIRTKLPRDLVEQIDAMAWIYDNWTSN